MSPSFDHLTNGKNREPQEGEGYVVSNGGRISLEMLRRLQNIVSEIPFDPGEVLRYYSGQQDFLPEQDRDDTVLLERYLGDREVELLPFNKSGDYFRSTIISPPEGDEGTGRERK